MLTCLTHRVAHCGQSHKLNQERFDYRTGILASPSEVDAAEWNALLAQADATHAVSAA